MLHTLWIVITLTYRNRGDLVELLQLLWENRDVIASGGVVILTGTAAGAHFIRLRKVEEKLLRTRERVGNYRERIQTEKEERRKREAITVHPVTRRLIGKSRKGHSAAKEKKTMLQNPVALLVLIVVALVTSYFFQQISVFIDLYVLKNGADFLIGLAFWVLIAFVVDLQMQVNSLGRQLVVPQEEHKDESAQ